MLNMTERVRTRHASLERVIKIVYEKFGKTPLNMAVVHARDKDSANYMMDEVRKSFVIHELIMTDLAISIAANLGPGTVGIVAYPE